MIIRQVCIVMTLLVVSFGVVAGQNVWVDLEEVRYWKDNTEFPLTNECILTAHLPADSLIIPVRVSNADHVRTAISNGFLFGGTATWTAITANFNPEYPWNHDMAFDLGCIAPACLPYFDKNTYTMHCDADLNILLDGYDPADVTGVAFAGLTGALNSGSGLPADFNGIAFLVTICGVDGDYGAFIEMDTTWWKPSNRWIWSGGEDGEEPDWDGPYTIWLGTASDISIDNGAGVPAGFSLSQNFPNPFNPATTLAFDVPHRANVKIAVYNILGQPVRTLINREMAAGSYTTDWDGTTDSGTPVSSGVYLCSMQAGEFSSRLKMVLLK